MIHDNILSTIGRTPVVRVRSLEPEGIELYVKVEAFNPLGSVKDRLALGIIEAAERDGSLRPGQTVVEATSGNTGIGLAMVCAQKGYPLVVVMAESFSIERRRLMRFLGAKVVLTPAGAMGSGMLAKARELADAHGWFLCRQFSNEANADIHSATTAEEILQDFPDGALDCFVTGFGTGGTLKGVARVLRERSPKTRIVATEPDNSPLLASGAVQAFDAEGQPAASQPSFRPHPMQGWSPDFVSRLTQDAVDGRLVDRIVGVAGKDALRLARDLARREGIFCGISSGATLAGALAACRDLPRGSRVLAMLPDTGERYLSTPLFADIGADMDPDEIALSTSTPNHRFDRPNPIAPAPTPASAVAAPPAAMPEATPQATAFLDETLGRRDASVVIFTLEWCEYCWSTLQFLDRLGIAYRSIELDAGAFKAEGWGTQVRAALRERVGSGSAPRVFVGGEHVGGCSDTFDAFKAGRLQPLLDRHGIAWRRDVELDPDQLLPRWLQARQAA